ncbi:MAG: GNAT family N-acetyltransferase [Dehalococcoidia bacterium]
MPHVEIRPATPEEMPAVAEQGSRQLALPISMFDGVSPEWTMCAFVNGELATTYAFWPLQLRLNGRVASMAGVTQVSTHPAHRRRGYLRAVTRRHFEEKHERGETAIACLHPAWDAIYRRYGYGLVHERTSYRVEPRQIAFHHPLELAGTVREVDLDTEFGLLVDVYRRYREDRTGLIHRGRAMWDAGPLQDPPAGHRRTVLAYEEGGEAQGYVVYHHGPGLERSGPEANQYLRVMDLFGLTPAAHQALWSILGNYDSVGEIRWDNAPADDPLPHMLVEPRMLQASTRGGIMARLVTVEAALTQRGYDRAGELRFELVDPFCEWNAGRWCLEASPEGASMRRIDGEAVDLRLTADTLASMAVGFLPASRASAAGLLEDVANASVLERWDSTLRTLHPPHEAEHTW